jgi:hypothetical protein
MRAAALADEKTPDLEPGESSPEGEQRKGWKPFPGSLRCREVAAVLLLSQRASRHKMMGVTASALLP